MKISRREFLIKSTALGFASLVGIGKKTALASGPAGLISKKNSVTDTVILTTESLVQYFAKAGYIASPSAPIISGLPFNGGLNYDDYLIPSSQHMYVIQSSSRLEDIAKKNQKGTLPLFTAFGFARPLNSNPIETTKFIFDYLIANLGLNPTLIHITSTELIKPLLPTLEGYGISENKIQITHLSQAKKKGTGSGWFAPVGHPKNTGCPTYSIEYCMPDGKDLEIAEIGIQDLQAGAIGIERLTMAKNQAYFSWNDYLPRFKELLQADSEKNHDALPVGYYEILDLPKPA